MCECSRSLTFAKLLPYAKGLWFVVTNLLVDNLQLVKGRGDIASVEITESNCTVGCRWMGSLDSLVSVGKTRALILRGMCKPQWDSIHHSWLHWKTWGTPATSLFQSHRFNISFREITPFSPNCSPPPSRPAGILPFSRFPVSSSVFRSVLPLRNKVIIYNIIYILIYK